MAWETRGAGRRYRYHARRVGGRVVKTYIGRGPTAESYAENTQRHRNAEARVNALVEEVRDELAHQDRTIAAFCFGCDQILGDMLTALDFHYRQGRWRRRRD